MSASTDVPVTQRKDLSLGDAFREFARWPSPRTLAALVVVTAVVRLSLGDWTTADWVLPLAMIAAWPLAEWTTHILLLHMKPKRLGPVTLDPLFARKHREHHADPNDTELVFLPMVVIGTLLAVIVVAIPTLFPSIERGVTFLLALSVMALGYEWTHYLVHTSYRPKTAVYRALWRHHRLHHYKNENYWFGLTNTGADHLMRTAPDPSDVERSPTARDLLGTGSGRDTG